jgi:mRNA interferase RelE/StbE
MYKIEWKPKALRQLRKVPTQATKESIVDGVSTLTKWTDCKNVKKLVNRSGYRLRVGNWRILFEADTTLKIIDIEEVKKRDGNTY